MIPTNFKTLREATGLSQADLAEHLGNRTATVVAWEKGKQPVPSDAAEFVSKMASLVETATKNTIQWLQDNKQNTVNLLRYTQDDWEKFNAAEAAVMPYTKTHQVILQRVMTYGQRHSIKVNVVNFNPMAYQIWLNQQKLDDDKASRSLWAATQVPDIEAPTPSAGLQ